MTVASEKLFQWPLDKRYAAVLVICSVCTMWSMISGLKLAMRHLDAGQKATGTLAPNIRASQFAAFALSIPAFALTSFLSVVFVELAPVWYLLQVIIIALNFWRLPEVALMIVGGRQRLQLLIQEGAMRLPVQIYATPPCCCFRLCCGPKAPQAYDVPRLRLGIVQLSILQPLFGLSRLVFELETLMEASWVGSFSQREVVEKILRIVSQLVCASSCSGLFNLCRAYNERAEHEMGLGKILQYCQVYLMGLFLVPVVLESVILKVWGSRQLGGTDLTLTDSEIKAFASSLAVCLVAPLINHLAWGAFPVDRAHYPEVFPADGQEAGAVTRAVSLQTTKFCPFCGSPKLEKQEGLEAPTATCLSCGASGIPYQLTATSPMGDEEKASVALKERSDEAPLLGDGGAAAAEPNP